MDSQGRTASPWGGERGGYANWYMSDGAGIGSGGGGGGGGGGWARSSDGGQVGWVRGERGGYITRDPEAGARCKC